MRDLPSKPERRHHIAVVRALKYLDSNPSERPSLTDLAGAARISVSRLSRLFAAEVGESPYQAMLTRRLQRARELVARGEPLAWVARDTGFADQAHFCRLFKRRFGSSPGRFQRDCRRPDTSPTPASRDAARIQRKCETARGRRK